MWVWGEFSGMTLLDKQTPIHTFDWYIKWIASFILIVGMMLRTTQEYMFLDLTLSCIGAFGWLCVGVMWKDRSLIILNTVATTILLYGVIMGLTN